MITSGPDLFIYLVSRSDVIVIPWFVHLYVEIIHNLYRVDYLAYRWKNMVKLFYTTYISVDLAHHKIFRVKVGKGGIKDHNSFLIDVILFMNL